MKIYTKNGDKGRSSLFGGSQVSKTAPELCAYGTIDELNSLLGLILSLSQTDPSNQKLRKTYENWILNIQNHLFTLGSHLAVGDEAMRSYLEPLTQKPIVELELQIDQWENEIPPIKNFILPGGHTLSAYLHLARTVARRAEREVTQVVKPETELALVYLNRLSDFLFVMARWTQVQMGRQDILWNSK